MASMLLRWGRGVEVLAILDKTNERKYSGATLLDAATTPV